MFRFKYMTRVMRDEQTNEGGEGSAPTFTQAQFDELKNSMNASSSRESDMDKLMDDLENEAQGRKKK